MLCDCFYEEVNFTGASIAHKDNVKMQKYMKPMALSKSALIANVHDYITELKNWNQTRSCHTCSLHNLIASCQYH